MKESILTQSNTIEVYEIRTEEQEGREYLVVPVVMMRTGVHSGSLGPMLHTNEELGRNPGAWNGVPLVIGHPKEGDKFISANLPQNLALSVGRVFNVHMDGDKLKGECWIDIQRITALSPLALSHIQEGRALDVSIGSFTDIDVQSGIHEGKRYTAIARNHRPDHLALLPGERGACSWVDGCGIRTNSLLTLKRMKNEEMKNEQINAMKEFIREGFSVDFLLDNEASAQELIQKAQQTLDSMDNDQAVYFLSEVYNDHLIYRKRLRNSNGSERKTYKQNYTLNASDGTIEFSGEPVEVRREVKYIQVNEENPYTRTKFYTKKEGLQMAKTTKPCCPEKVEALITNEALPWTKDHEEWLLTQSPEFIEGLTPKKVVEKKVEKVVAPIPAVNTEAFIKKDDLKTTDDYLKIMPEEMRDQARSGLALHKEHRTKLIDAIVINSADGSWTKEELEKEDTSRLEKLNSSYVGKVNYSVNSTPSTNTVDENVEQMLPAGVE